MDRANPTNRVCFMKKMIVFVGLWIGMLVPVHAITFVQMPDQALLDQAPLVLEGEIIGTVPFIRQPQDYTVYRVDVTRYLKGYAYGEVEVWVPGSVEVDYAAVNNATRTGNATTRNSNSDSGSRRVIPGMPKFSTGDEVLLFLEPRADGAYAILQSVLGVFQKTTTPAGHVRAQRQLTGSYELPGTGLGVLLPAADQVRDWDGFTQWLQATATGAVLPPTYWNASADEEKPRTANFTTLGSPSRWFQFDADQTVAQVASAGGQSGITGGGFGEFQTGITAWNSDAGSNIRYVYGGTTGANGGLGNSDGVNAILFNDPNGDIAGSFNCTDGGVLASASFRTSGVGTFKGAVFRRIIESDIVIQDGAGCFLSGNGATNAAEVFAHELGHTLGLGHSCGDSEIVLGIPDCALNPTADDALMRAFVHADGRGAALRADDRAGAAFLYDAAASGGGEAPPPSGGGEGSSGGGGGGGGGGVDPVVLLLLMVLLAAIPRSRILALRAGPER